MVQKSYENHDVFGNYEETQELSSNILLFEYYLKTIKYNMYESTCKNCGNSVMSNTLFFRKLF